MACWRMDWPDRSGAARVPQRSASPISAQQLGCARGSDQACGPHRRLCYISAGGHVGPLAIAPDADAKAVVTTALRCALQGDVTRVSMLVPGRADVVMQTALALG